MGVDAVVGLWGLGEELDPLAGRLVVVVREEAECHLFGVRLWGQHRAARQHAGLVEQGDGAGPKLLQQLRHRRSFRVPFHSAAHVAWLCQLNGRVPGLDGLGGERVDRHAFHDLRADGAGQRVVVEPEHWLVRTHLAQRMVADHGQHFDLHSGVQELQDVVQVHDGGHLQDHLDTEVGVQLRHVCSEGQVVVLSGERLRDRLGPLETRDLPLRGHQENAVLGLREAFLEDLRVHRANDHDGELRLP
mmetsp:Transcript_132324/g.229431  ORF Transcript_132324/g.229431 Transcript_132324/m.229431 type:complete len:246 (+) Transcript_132324:2116-2853(+)